MYEQARSIVFECFEGEFKGTVLSPPPPGKKIILDPRPIRLGYILFSRLPFQWVHGYCPRFIQGVLHHCLTDEGVVNGDHHDTIQSCVRIVQ